MAVVGNAKNARLTVKTGYGDYGGGEFWVRIRGNKYQFFSNDEEGDSGIVRLPSTLLAGGSFLQPNTNYIIEAIDNTLKIMNSGGGVILQATDSTYLVAGNWEIDYGTLVSFESLDAGPAESVSLDRSTLFLVKPTTYKLIPTVLPVNAPDKTVTWASSNPAVATVSPDGTVTPVRYGTTTITCTTSNGVGSATCAVTIDSFESVSVTGHTIPKNTIEASETILAGEYIFGDRTNLSNVLLHQYYGPPLNYKQTKDGIAWLVDGNAGMGILHPWLAFDKYKDYSVEVEFYCNAAARASMDTAMVWYPNENRYAHLPKPIPAGYWRGDIIGYRYRSPATGGEGVTPLTTEVPWGQAVNKWIKLRQDYRVIDGKGYVKGAVTIDGVTTTSQEIVIDDVTAYPNPTVSPTVWALGTGGRIAYRNLKVLSGALSAYSLLFGMEAFHTTKANGQSWGAYTGPNTYYRDNLYFSIITDGNSNIAGTGNLRLPQFNLPLSSDFERFDVQTSIGAGESISYTIKDTNSNVVQSGNLANGYNSISLTSLTEKSLIFELDFNGGSINLLDVAWTTPEQHTLTYNANGGTGTIPSETGFEFTLASAGFTNGDLLLAGWNTKADGTGTSYALGQTVSFLEDTTLYAVWVEANIPLYFSELEVQDLYLGELHAGGLCFGETKIY